MWRIATLILLAGTRAFAQGAVPVPPCPGVVTAPWNSQDYSVMTADLPALRARWQKRGSVAYRGVVPVVLDVRERKLFITFIAPMGQPRDEGAATDIMLFDESEPPPLGESFEPLWKDRKTGRSVGPIHAAIRVRPRTDSSELERRQVVVYNPPDRPDILLVAKREFPDDDWTPLVRVDLPKATRFDVMHMLSH